MTPFERGRLAARVAADIPDGWYVNLGIGIPTLVADHFGPDREVVFHSENGVLGMGPAPLPGQVDPWLINAGKQHVTLCPGGAYLNQADSFGIIRGGHLDLCVLGAFEVAENGDIANWATLDTGVAPAVGGAMDLATGVKRLWVAMEHLTKDGRARIVQRCSYPLTAHAVVQRIYTELGVFEVTPQGLVVTELAPDVTFDYVREHSGGACLIALQPFHSKQK